jgi:hypothetical protein
MATPSLTARSYTNALHLLLRWQCAAGDTNMATQLSKGDVLQLERKGYYIVDQPAVLAAPGGPEQAQPAVLLAIPDGRAKSVASKGAAAASPSPAPSNSTGRG